MFTPLTPAEYEAVLNKFRSEYKELYARYCKTLKRKCHCDRINCSRCCELDNIRRSMCALRAYGKAYTRGKK